MTKKRPVLVLGATGFIGRHVSRQLSNSGVSVIGLGHGTWDEAEWSAWGLSRWLQGTVDLATLESLPLDDGFPCAVVHCAGGSAVSQSYAAPHRDFERTVDSTAALLEWVRKAGQRDCRSVMVSSAAVYGDHGDVDFEESSPLRPISPYGVHKLVAERLCESYSRFFGARVSIVRLFSVYGRGLRKQLLWDALNKFSRDQATFFGTGEELRDWIHVDDAARLLVDAALTDQSPFEIYNGGHAHATTRQVLARLADAYAGGPPPTFSGETHTGNPRRLTAAGSRAGELLGWAPSIGLADGLAGYVDWFRQMASHDAATRGAP